MKKKINFKMDAEDFCQGYRLRLKSVGIKGNGSKLVVYAILCAIIIALFAYLGSLLIGLLMAGMIFVISLLLSNITTNKKLEREFSMSPFIRREKTIIFDESSICFVTSFEKIKIPFEHICRYEINVDRVLILPIFSSECFVINKNKYACLELNDLCALLREKCDNSNKSVEEEREQIDNSVSSNSLPITFDMQINDDDIISNQRIALKRTRFLSFLYITAIFFVGYNIYQYVATQEVTFLASAIVFGAATAMITVYEYFINTKILARKTARADKFASLKRTVCFNREFVEIKSISQKYDVEINKILPYSYIKIASENNDYYSLLADSERHLLIPKRYLTIAQTEVLTALFKEKCYYLKMR